MINRPIFISIIPNLLGGEGHVYDYHQSVQKSAESLGWDYFAATPPDPVLSNPRPHWVPCLTGKNLEDDTSELAKALNWFGIFNWAFKVAGFLTDKVSKQRPTIVFLERFIPSQLLGLVIALCLLPRQDLSVWLFYRIDAHRHKARLIYRGLTWLIQWRLRPDRLKLLTDSALLQKALSVYFDQSVTVFPIPHTDVEIEGPELEMSDSGDLNQIICWWAGAPRVEKGLEVIRTLTQYSRPEAEKLCFVVPKGAHLVEREGSIRLRMIEDKISRSEYLQWLWKSDLILLPYDVNAYIERTSGIFVEAIIAGKIPVVTANTWMASELIKYDLAPLVVADWQTEEMLNRLFRLSRDPVVHEKIAAMKLSYQGYHNSKSYSETMEKLFIQQWV